jgi:indolepyruvate ferredoxin oxidoreductase
LYPARRGYHPGRLLHAEAHVVSVAGRQISLDDRYLLEEGTVYLSGLQSLVRLPIEQDRRDRRAGLRIGTFISGYPGSPLGGYDLALKAARPILEQHDVHHVPGANEELAATAISGTQMLDHYPHSRYDGVVGIWYGKGPGVDRSGDALKHGNFAGTSRHGAVVVLSGEDHEAKSSTMPFQDDYAFVCHGMPILYPASVAEFLELGLHAVALSRYSGCWVAMKLVGALCDGGQTVDVHPQRPEIVLPELVLPGGKPFQKRTDFTFFPGLTIETERQLYYERHLAVRTYARANGLDRVEVRSGADRLAIVAAGKSYADTRQALLDMGISDEDLRRAGVRLVKVGCIYPLDPAAAREWLEGVEQVLVIEEKRGFLESQLKEALSGTPVGILGKLDEHSQPLFPIQGGMDADAIAEWLGPRLLSHLGGTHAGILGRLAELRAIRSRAYEVLLARTPNYCSGCPHNTSTKLLDGELAWGSPGCHSFASIIEQPERHIVSMTQLGGEGLPWIGLERFTDREHIVQHVGDGSLFHSSYLNIRFAAAVGADITFKILYNGYIANTGAQESVNLKSVPNLVRLLEVEGVKRIALLTREPREYRGERFDRQITRVYPVEEQDQALRELAATRGTTVLLYDGTCANERRRRQKRGMLPKPDRFVVINQDVCENCGHCGALTNCMSLAKVETEFGTKTQVHQSSCNQDYACLGGDCPSFVTVETRPGSGLRKPTTPTLGADEIPAPVPQVSLEQPYRVYIPGVGGTGVITINALLCYAALADGKRVLSYDQTGAAQKWGPVLSSLVMHAEGQAVAANKVGAGQADLYLAFDPMAGATAVNLDRCDPSRTAAVANATPLPSGEMVRNVWLDPRTDDMLAAIQRWTDASRTVHVDALELAEGLFGDYMAMNMLALGAAFQAGLLPLGAASIEVAIRLNGVQVEQNLQAFRYGRLFVHDPARVRALLHTPRHGYAEQRRAALANLRQAEGLAYQGLLARCEHLDEESKHLLAVRVAELIEYQDAHYAEQYLDFVLKVAEREQAVLGFAGRAPGVRAGRGGEQTERHGDGATGRQGDAESPLPLGEGQGEGVPGAGAGAQREGVLPAGAGTQSEGVPGGRQYEPLVTRAVIRYLFKLMAYKDEYEVARLQTNAAFLERTEGMFERPRRLVYHLHPPLLRALGLERKLQFGPWFRPVLRGLRGMKRLRGTPLDPFGYARVRREERRLIGWYRELVEGSLEHLRPDTHALVAEIARTPDLVRGYEHIKLENIQRASQHADTLMAELQAATPGAGVAMLP